MTFFRSIRRLRQYVALMRNVVKGPKSAHPYVLCSILQAGWRWSVSIASHVNVPLILIRKISFRGVMEARDSQMAYSRESRRYDCLSATRILLVRQPHEAWTWSVRIFADRGRREIDCAVNVIQVRDVNRFTRRFSVADSILETVEDVQIMASRTCRAS